VRRQLSLSLSLSHTHTGESVVFRHTSHLQPQEAVLETHHSVSTFFWSRLQTQGTHFSSVLERSRAFGSSTDIVLFLFICNPACVILKSSLRLNQSPINFPTLQKISFFLTIFLSSFPVPKMKHSEIKIHLLENQNDYKECRKLELSLFFVTFLLLLLCQKYCHVIQNDPVRIRNPFLKIKISLNNVKII